MTLKFLTTGRPLVECPKCGNLHGIYRKGEYLKKSQVKATCSTCGTKWNLDPEDTEKIKVHYEERERKNEEKRRSKEEKSQTKVEKPVQEKDEKSQKNLEKPQKDKPKKSKSFWDQIGLGD